MNNLDYLIGDIEVAPNLLMVGLLNPKNNKRHILKIYNREPTMYDRRRVRDVLTRVRFTGFNVAYYDVPILIGLVQGLTLSQLYQLSHALVNQDQNAHAVMQSYGVELAANGCHYLDLMQLTAGRVGLKTLGARLGAKRLADLPFDPNAPVDDEEVALVAIIERYLHNDLDLTLDLFKQLREEVAVRERTAELFDFEAWHGTTPAMAEHLIQTAFYDQTGIRRSQLYDRKNAAHGFDRFSFTLPSWWKPKSSGALALGALYEGEHAIHEGKVANPYRGNTESLVGNDFAIAFGMGGLHSIDGPGIWRENADFALMDADVGSFYPSIMINHCLIPHAYQNGVLPDAFTRTLKQFKRARMDAKQRGDKVTAGVYKIALNSLYGRSGYLNSTLFDPRITATVCWLGQLALVQLIEDLSNVDGLVMVSANTDSVLARVPRRKGGEYIKVCKRWQANTGFDLEFTPMRLLARRDVNAYVAVFGNGEHKAKGGDFTTSVAGDLMHSSNAIVSSQAAVAVLTGECTPDDIKKRIRQQTDIRGFTLMKKSNLRARQGDVLFDKTLRWYWTSEEVDPIVTLEPDTKGLQGKIIATGSRMVLDLPDSLPRDLDVARYVARAQDIVASCGVDADPIRAKRVRHWLALGLPLALKDGARNPAKGMSVYSDCSGVADDGFAVPTGKRAGVVATKERQQGTVSGVDVDGVRWWFLSIPAGCDWVGLKKRLKKADSKLRAGRCVVLASLESLDGEKIAPAGGVPALMEQDPMGGSDKPSNLEKGSFYEPEQYTSKPCECARSHS